jgi:energy-coupling factor transport system substrate-specific component
MTWILASTLLLGAVLVTGFAWYERTHPSTRVLALVATLAALAALGRVAFAPLPNVKPTTDIVLIAGLVLGGAPGFMVGAVAAVASNLFFGQGPWTPWQMAAWGAVGVAGALLARVARGREIGRVTLAIACGLAGLAFGAVMNLHLWITYSGDHSLAKLGAYFATSLPFDLAHSFGNVVFALAFGPALIRALQRFRSRMEVTWLATPRAAVTAATGGSAGATGATAGAVGGGAAVVLLAVVVAASTAPPRAEAQSADAAAANASVRYLANAQNDDGGWGGAPGQSSTSLHTGWTALGLAAAGRNPRDVGSTSAVDYIRAHASDLDDLGELSRTILVFRAAGLSPRNVGGRDLVAELLRKRKANGSFAGRVNTTAFAALALKATGSGPKALRGAGRWIAGQANPDGGFNFAGKGGPSGIDDTGAAIQGLVAAGRKRTTTVKRAARFLVKRQNADGGFPLVPGGESNAQSTAWAIQGLLAAGRDPAKVRRSRDPLAYLRSLTSSSGETRYSRTSRQTPVWVTAQAVMALARKPLPLKPVARATRAQAAPAAPAATAAPSSGATARSAKAARRGGASRAAGSATGRTAKPAKAAGAAAAPATAASATPQRLLAGAAARAVAVPADARRAGYVAGLAAFAVL